MLVFDINVSHGSVATHLRCGGMFHNDFFCKFTTESVSERILKIGQHLAKLQTKV